MAEIKLERPQEPARLRVYIGAAPGVGKTYDMINDAYRMKHQQGMDVVIGLVETHGREETAARVRDLEVVPQREIPYRGVTLKEMDVDAILARHPQTVIAIGNSRTRGDRGPRTRSGGCTPARDSLPWRHPERDGRGRHSGAPSANRHCDRKLTDARRPRPAYEIWRLYPSARFPTVASP